MMDTGSIKRKGKMPLFWHFMAAEKTEIGCGIER